MNQDNQNVIDTIQFLLNMNCEFHSKQDKMIVMTIMYRYLMENLDMIKNPVFLKFVCTTYEKLFEFDTVYKQKDDFKPTSFELFEKTMTEYKQNIEQYFKERLIRDGYKHYLNPDISTLLNISTYPNVIAFCKEQEEKNNELEKTKCNKNQTNCNSRTL